MTRVLFSTRLARTNARQLILILSFFCATLHLVEGFSSVSLKQTSLRVDCAFHRNRTLLRDQNMFRESRFVPRVVNPISKRHIHLGGPKYSEFMKEGGWVQHQGTLKRIDLRMLARYQRGSSYRPKITKFEEHGNTSDKWYPVTPVVLRRLEDPSDQITMDEKTTEKLRRELLFVNKPSHLHCVPNRSLSDSLATQVQLSHPGSKPCHRLDRDTSGIVLFGLTKESHRDVSMQFEARTTSKTYMALVAGRPEKDHGIVKLPIGKQKTKEGFNRWTIGGDKPRESITHWAVKKVFTDEEIGAVFTKVILKPVTGRGHQLRLHMKAIGCPILGDTIHGEDGVAMCSSRLCLHAHRLRVDWNGFRLEAESVTPF